MMAGTEGQVVIFTGYTIDSVDKKCILCSHIFQSHWETYGEPKYYGCSACNECEGFKDDAVIQAIG